MEKKFKNALIVCVIVIIALIIALIYSINKNKALLSYEKEGNYDIMAKTPISTTRKISSYIDILSSDFYMKYKTKDLSQDSAGIFDTTAEFATKNGKTVINDLVDDMKILSTDKMVYYILNEEKIIYKSEVGENSANAPIYNSTNRQRTTCCCF